MALNDITRRTVLKAIDEYDRKGEAAFLSEYGFRPSREYWLIHNDRSYVSKAVANVAQAIGMNRRYSHDIRISGGEDWVVGRLRELHFHVHKGTRPKDQKPRKVQNSDWTREELILALELYMRKPESPPGKQSPEVAELSAILNRLGVITGAQRNDKFRNTNGVYMKMMNFRRWHPRFTQAGKVGMTSGSKLEKPVWDEFEGRPDDLKHAATVIRLTVNDPNLARAVEAIGTGDDEGAAEGGFSHRLHRVYERDRAIIAKKKKAILAETGALRCEACEFDFTERYGSLGAGYIEVHHKRPVFLMRLGERTKVEDLALLCSNCHRMVHRTRNPRPVDEIAALVRTTAP